MMIGKSAQRIIEIGIRGSQLISAFQIFNFPRKMDSFNNVELAYGFASLYDPVIGVSVVKWSKSGLEGTALGRHVLC